MVTPASFASQLSQHLVHTSVSTKDHHFRLNEAKSAAETQEMEFAKKCSTPATLSLDGRGPAGKGSVKKLRNFTGKCLNHKQDCCLQRQLGSGE